MGRDQNDAGATLRSGSTTISSVGNLLQTAYAPIELGLFGGLGRPDPGAGGSAWSVAGITSATSMNVCNTGTNFYQAVRQSSVSAFILQHAPDTAQHDAARVAMHVTLRVRAAASLASI